MFYFEALSPQFHPVFSRKQRKWEMGTSHRGRNSPLSSELRANGHLVVSPCHCVTVSPSYCLPGNLSGEMCGQQTPRRPLEPLYVSSDSSRGYLFPSNLHFPPAQLTSADTSTVIKNSLPIPTLAFLIHLSWIFLFSASVSSVSPHLSVSLSSSFFSNKSSAS